MKKVKKKQKSKNLSLQDLETRIEKIDSKFEYLNDTMNKVLALLQKKNMTLEKKPTSGKSRMNSQISSKSYDDAGNDYDDDEFSETSDIESADNESNEEEDDDEQGEFSEEYEERDETQQQPYQSQQPQQLKRRQQMIYPISPVESTDSFTGNDQQNVMVPPIVATNNSSSTNDNFSFGNNITQFEMSMNTLESSIDNKLNFLYSEMPSIANQLEGSLYWIGQLPSPSSCLRPCLLHDIAPYNINIQFLLKRLLHILGFKYSCFLILMFCYLIFNRY